MDEQTTFECIMSRVFRKGLDAAADYFGKPMPHNPYKRPQYQSEWERGYQIGTKSINDKLKSIEWLENLKSQSKQV